MTVYRVFISASYEVEAENEEEACNKAHDAVLNQELKMREFEFSPEETDHDEPQNY